MKIAVTYNSQHGDVYSRRGIPSHEWLREDRVFQIAEQLHALGHEAIAVDADLHVIRRLTDFFGRSELADDSAASHLVFNLAYGLQGELRYCHLPAMLEMLGLPYVGSGPLGHTLAYDKLTAKRLFRAAGLPTPEGAPHGTRRTAGERETVPAVVKPVADAASEGMEVATQAHELKVAVDHVQGEDGPVLAEQFIEGREINISLVGNGEDLHTLPPVEVVIHGDGPAVYDGDTKKGQGDRSFELVCPAELSAAQLKKADEIAKHAFEILRLRDWARADLRLSPEGHWYLLEMNTIPGIGPHSSFRRACEHGGIESLADLLTRLIDVANARYELQATV